LTIRIDRFGVLRLSLSLKRTVVLGPSGLGGIPNFCDEFVD
jgi:hypothetical protein